MPQPFNGQRPITRVVRKVKDKDGELITMMTGIPIAQSKTEVLVVTNAHFLNGAKTKQCLLGESGKIVGEVVATDPENDLALIVGKVDAIKNRWALATLADKDATSGPAATLGYPEGKPLIRGTGTVVSNGWMSRRFIEGESGGMVAQGRKVIGVISARTPRPSEASNPGLQKALGLSSAEQVVAYYSDLERSGRLGSFVPVSKVHAFVKEASLALALDYPVFTTFFKEREHEISGIGN